MKKEIDSLVGRITFDKGELRHGVYDTLSNELTRFLSELLDRSGVNPTYYNQITFKVKIKGEKYES